MQPEQLGPAFDFWQKLWEKEQSLLENQANQINQHVQVDSMASESYILVDENDYAKGLKRKRDVSNKASTSMGLSKHRNRLIGKYNGCPWMIPGKVYSKGING